MENKLTVRELINLLSSLPQDANVYVNERGEYRAMAPADVIATNGLTDDTGEDIDEEVVVIETWG